MTPLTTQQKLEAITARICEVVPGIAKKKRKGRIVKDGYEIDAEERRVFDTIIVYRDITLEDVLMLPILSDLSMEFDLCDGILTLKKMSVTHCGCCWPEVESIGEWKLGKPLHQQDPSTIDWLYSLLPSSK